MLEQKWYCRSSQLISAECVFPPMPCEALFAHLQERRRLVSARVVNGDRKRRELFRLCDEAFGILSARGVADDEGDSCSRFSQLIGCRLKLDGIAARDRHRMSALCESSSYGCTQAERCTDADDEHGGLRCF